MVGLVSPTGTSNTCGVRALMRVRRGFSLIELVIVVVIIGIIAAIAVPRMSRGSAGASDGALTANLTVLRNAVDLYQTEHTTYPATGSYTTALDFVKQLTKYSDGTGAGSDTKDAAHPYGPYLRKIPPLPVGSKKGKSGVKIAGSDAEAPGGGTADEAWLYFPNTGEIKANLPATEVDSNSTPYNQY